ncbi:MAG: hypothetical protein M3O30_13055 [Planctomycetota bacterium]|nr:hypothetical protein [Planctomycetota bacterium]
MANSPRAKAICLSLFAWALSVPIFVTGISRADSVHLPLYGYFHPGRAMPVQWDRAQRSTDDAVIDLSADGAIGAHVRIGDSMHGTFAWLVVSDDPHNVQLRIAGGSETSLNAPLHPLEVENRLIASAGADDSLSEDIFPQHQKIRIHLNSTDFLNGPAMAWESLDALILTPAELAAISTKKQQELLADGIVLAVTGDLPPSTKFSWQKSGRLWTAATNLPVPPVIEPRAYAPTFGWIGGKSTGIRQRGLLLGAVFCILAWGLGLWRGAWMPVAMFFLSAAAIVVFGIYRDYQSPAAITGGKIQLAGLPIAMEDCWIYLRSHKDVEFEQPVDGIVSPVFFDEADFQQENLTFICDSLGEPIFLAGHLQADWPLAIWCRRIAQPLPQTELNTATSPLRALNVRSIYPGFLIAGQKEKPNSDELGDSIFVSRPDFNKTSAP